MAELTGKALFQVHRTIQPYDLKWSEAGESVQAFYNNIAEQINARYLVLIQPSSQALTGQILHELFLETDPTTIHPWQNVSALGKERYNKTAQLLAERYIAPLQGEIEELRVGFKRLKVMDGDIQRDQDKEIAELEQENKALDELLTGLRADIQTMQETGFTQLQHENDALKSLARDWQTVTQEFISRSTSMSLEEMSEWFRQWQELKKSTQELLEAEQKEG